MKYGVPQGSVLGPLLLILYSNDIHPSLINTKSILFADDTTVYLTRSNRVGMYEHLNVDLLNSLHDWFSANQLSVNHTKTKYIHFHRRTSVLSTEI